MELNKQVVSLNLSKRLKSLKVPQESLFMWFPLKEKQKKIDEDKDWGIAPSFKLDKQAYRIGEFMAGTDLISAFTVSELGEMLKEKFGLEIPVFNEGMWRWQYKEEFELEDCSEANARAKMLCYLLENNLITL